MEKTPSLLVYRNFSYSGLNLLTVFFPYYLRSQILKGYKLSNR